ncbi:MAG: hypothetical protein P8M72_06760 [Gammaproteobacteria bacterium]|nr:hypothetical protein [Gammaproteobacteria bacterium]
MDKFNATRNRLSALAIVLLLTALAAGCSTPVDENGNALVRDRECRTTGTRGSKMRESVCLNTAQWAQIDAREIERRTQEQQKDDLLNRIEDYNLQNPVKPGDPYNPYPSL